MTGTLRHALAFTFALGVALASPPAHAACEDEGNLCVDTEGVDWFPDERLSDEQITKERGKNERRDPGKLYLTIENGRGSLFLNGKWAGTAPVEGVEIKPGRHDLQVRDGDSVLSEGVLTVPRKFTEVRLTVRHP